MINCVAGEGTEFFDPISGTWTATRQHRNDRGMYASTYGASAATVSSAMFYSAFDATHADDDFSHPARHSREDSVSLIRTQWRIHFNNVTMQFSENNDTVADPQDPALNISSRVLDAVFSECFFDLTYHRRIVESDIAKTATSARIDTFHCSVLSLGIWEHAVRATDDNENMQWKRCLLAFDSSLRDSEISAGPAIDIEITESSPSVVQNELRRCLNVGVRMRSVFTSLHIDSLTFWTDVFSSLPIPATGEASSMDVSINVDCPSLDLVVHSDLSHAKSKWKDLCSALDLSNTAPSPGVHIPSPWRNVAPSEGNPAGNSDLYSMLLQSPGGLWATFESISVAKRIGTPPSTTDPTETIDNTYCRLLAVDKLILKLFLLELNQSQVQETLILEAFKSTSSREGITVDSTVTQRRTTEDEIGNPGNYSIYPPSQEQGLIVYIKADTISVDIAQREYNAMISISGFFTPSRMPVPDADMIQPRRFLYPKKLLSNGRETNASGFGIVLSASTCTIRVASSDDFSCVQGFHRHASDELPLAEILQRTFAAKYDGPMEFTPCLGSDLSDPFVFSIASKAIVLEMFSAANQTYFTASALEISIFECEQSDLRSGVTPSIPILHRSSLVHDISSHESSDIHQGPGVSPRDGWILVNDSYDDFGNDMRINIPSSSAPKRQVYVDPRALSFLLYRPSYIQHVSNTGLLPSTTGAESMGGLRAVSLQALIAEQPSLLAPSESNQDIQFHVDFQNVTHHLDPKSNWINKIVSLMTPIRPETVLERRSSIRLQALKLQSVTRSTYQTQLESMNHTVAAHLEDADTTPAPTPFAVTKVSVNVASCLIDYKCQENGSRLLLSIGTLAIFTTIVSSSNLFTVKVTADDIDTYVSKHLNSRPELEQNPLGIEGFIKPIDLTDSAREKLRCEFDVDAPASDAAVGIHNASEFLDLHQFVPLLALSKTSLLVTINTQFGSINRDVFILRNRGTLLVESRHEGTDSTEDIVIDSSGRVDLDADDENISGFSATSVVMSMHGCNFEARMDTIDALIVS